MKKEVEAELVRMLQRDNQKMRRAGLHLAECASRVVKEYDGIHRLSLAVSKWYEVVANEGDRDLTKKPNNKKEKS